MTYTWKGKPADLFMECVDERGQQVAVIEGTQGPVFWTAISDDVNEETCADCGPGGGPDCRTCWLNAIAKATRALFERRT